ncbi:hypothetical protein F3V92_22585 [Salmonella enterica]|nr:hypothetical protein [Salmonella enterica]
MRNRIYIKSILILLLILPCVAKAGYYDYSTTINQHFDLNSPPDSVDVWNVTYPVDAPKLPRTAFGPFGNFALSCLSASDAQYGACSTYPARDFKGPGEYVRLAFSEQRTHLVKELTIMGYYANTYGFSKPFADILTPAILVPQKIHAYIPASELKKLPIGGVWKAHAKLPVWAMHTYKTHIIAYWTSDITLDVIDPHSIRIWLPQYYGSSANVVMPINPSYWALHHPGMVSSEKVVDTCLYDGYNSNSSHFDVMFNSDLVDAGSGDFLLKNISSPESKPLHYQVIASSPGGSDTPRVLKAGITQTYTGMNNVGIHQVMMPGLQAPVACVPWPIKLKMKPFDLSRQPAGHYSGVLNITFTPSLE